MRVIPALFLAAASSSAFAMLAPQQQPPNPNPNNPSPTNPKDPQTDPSRRTGTEGRAATSDRSNDDLLATWLLIENRNAVQIAEFAQQRAQNPDVKQFAQKMAENHRQFVQKLQGFSQWRGDTGDMRRPGTEPSREGVAGREPATGHEGREGGAYGREAGGDRESMGKVEPIALVQELGRQCLETARKELTQKSGAEFDKCFVGMALGGHMKANDVLTVFGKHASGELKNVISEEQKTVQADLERAKDLAKKLDGDKDKDKDKGDQGPGGGR
jgi:predicted outer membrane protein